MHQSRELMLAFGSARQKESAIRLAIGGTRIERRAPTAGLDALSVAGGALRLLTPTWATQRLVSSMAAVFPIFLALDLTPETTVLLATIGIRMALGAQTRDVLKMVVGHVLLLAVMFCSVATIAFGLWPALRLSRPDLLPSLKDQVGEISDKIGDRITVRDALVTAQVALSLALLVVSGSFVRGAARGASANPGFDVGQLTIAEVDTLLGGYGAAQTREVETTDAARLAKGGLLEG